MQEKDILYFKQYDYGIWDPKVYKHERRGWGELSHPLLYTQELLVLVKKQDNYFEKMNVKKRGKISSICCNIGKLNIVSKGVKWYN